MKAILAKESSEQYVIEFNRTTVTDEPVMLEAHGVPVAVLVPVDEYEAFRAWRVGRQRPTEPSLPPEFEREVDAFEVLRPQLRARYSGHAVAIYHGQVVAEGDDKMAVLQTVQKTFGLVPCYIEWVDEDAPRTARISSAWIAG